MTNEATHRAIHAVFRIEQAKLIAQLTRLTRDVGLAEELAQDALVAALETWPAQGVPDRPAAWLLATAKRKGVDRLRKERLVDAKQEAVTRELTEAHERAAIDLDAALDDAIGDDLLRLIFISCHPLLSTEARVALTLRLLGGLTIAEIARAFLVPEPTVAQRIVRAKRTLADAQVPFEVPGRDELAARLSSVLEVIYLVFNEGYAATAGDDWMRPGLCEDALRLGRVLAGLLPDEPEVHGLVSLMELQTSRSAARTAHDGTPILLLEQDRARWNRLFIQRGLAALARSLELSPAPGVYTLQAAISACHARALTAAETDWPRICALYRALVALTQSPVIELNRAVAVAMAEGPQSGLTIADSLRDARVLDSYHLLHTVRADLLSKLGRHEEARAEFERAASLTRNERERQVLLARAAAALASTSSSTS